MARGGYREKAGRKTSWASGCKFEDTKIIRVPISIANKLLDIAHKLDERGSLDLDTKSKEQIERLKSENILLRTKMVELESKIRDIDNEKQLSILDITQNKTYTLEDLTAKAKSIIYDETIVRTRDRGAARKYFGLLLDVDKDLFK
jgi:hypothetical protein